jgi:isoleucyl-tRNA synthetase
VHLRLYPETPAGWRDETLAERWAKIRDIRRVVTGALEVARAEKKIGSGLQAKPTVYLSAERKQQIAGIAVDEIAITSDVTLASGDAPSGAFALPDVPGVGVVVALADGAKCERCWQVLPEVGTHKDHPTLCNRCTEAVSHMEPAA